MSGFLHIKKIIIPKNELNKVYNFLQYAGTKKVEGVGLFAGQELFDQFRVTNGIVPKQKNYRLHTGLLYAVDAEELHRINIWLHANNLQLIAQIHSHPHEAYHSETDDRFPIVDTYGGISIVVPDFASQDPHLDDWAIYRCSPSKGWEMLNYSQSENLFCIE